MDNQNSIDPFLVTLTRLRIIYIDPYLISKAYVALLDPAIECFNDYLKEKLKGFPQ